MGDNWDDSDDDWDVDDDDLDAKLGLNKAAPAAAAGQFDDEEEDLAVIEKAREDKLKTQELKKKGNARLEKQRKEAEAKEEEELARKAMELEAEMEANMTIDERRALERQRIEDADNELTNDLFGAVESSIAKQKGGGVGGKAMEAGDTVNLKDLKDHLKHARKVAQCIKKHGKINLGTAFIKEVINDCSSLLDDAAITDIIKTCNVIKNEKVAASKRKVKGEATKIKKVDKKAQAKALKIQNELYGDSNKYDKYDEIGDDYEDAFF